MTSYDTDRCCRATTCTSAAVSAAVACVLAVRWTAPSPKDMFTLASALGTLRRSLVLTVNLAVAFHAAQAAAESSAAHWYSHLDMSRADSRREEAAAAVEIRDVLDIADCTCAAPLTPEAVVSAALSDALIGLTEFVREHSDRPATGMPVVIHHLRSTATGLVVVLARLNPFRRALDPPPSPL